MSPEQKQNAVAIAKAIRNGRNSVTESFAVGQVMIVTGCPYDKAVKGLQAIRDEKLLDGFIDRKTDGALARMLVNNTSLKKLIDRLDAIPGRSEVVEFQGFVRPQPVDRALLLKRFSIDGF